MYAADVEYRNHLNICPLMAFLLFSFFSPLLSSPCSFLSLQQFALSIHEGCLPFSAFTTSAPWTRWRRSVGPCTSASWHPASPPKEKASSPCSSGRPSEELCCHCWTTTTGVDLSSSMTQTEVNACLLTTRGFTTHNVVEILWKTIFRSTNILGFFLLGSSFLTFFYWSFSDVKTQEQWIHKSWVMALRDCAFAPYFFSYSVVVVAHKWHCEKNIKTFVPCRKTFMDQKMFGNDLLQ